MANKDFNQMAVDEVTRGKIDRTLRADVIANFVGLDAIACREKYIQLRAEELASGRSLPLPGRLTFRKWW